MLRASEEAAIHNVTSPIAFVPRGSIPLYSATKAGLRAFTKALRAQLEGVGIRVFEILSPLVGTVIIVNRQAPKISPEEMVRKLMRKLANDTCEVRTGEAKWFLALHRIMPGRTERSMHKLRDQWLASALRHTVFRPTLAAQQVWCETARSSPRSAG